MKILFTYKITSSVVLGNIEVLEFADWECWENEELVQFLREENPNAVISRSSTMINRLGQLKSSGSIANELIILHLIHSSTAEASGKEAEHVVFFEEPNLAEIRALQYLEGISQSRIFYPYQKNLSIKDNDVVLVGAGIVNLMTALRLVQAGYKLQVYDSGPEPYIETNWASYGCTWGGADARIFSFNESRQHQYEAARLFKPVNDQYRKTVSEEGWLSCPVNSLTELDRSWIREYESYPQWLYEKINQEIIEFNRESYQYWQQLQCELPELFENVGFIDHLLRVYPTEESYQNGIITEKRIHSFMRELSRNDVNELLPCWKESHDEHGVYGVIEVNGFGINIHRFMKKITEYLISKGVEFFWNESINHIEYDLSGNVIAIHGVNKTIEASHYVISPGVPGESTLLKGTASNRRIGAMVGCWITVPNLESALQYPLKVSRTGYAAYEAAAGANIIPARNAKGEEVLHISSGHGFIGLNPQNLHKAYLQDLSRAVHETTSQLFPKAYQEADRRGWFTGPIRYCIRPWTASCLGLFEMVPTSRGGLLIINGGHNTGGFAHAPVISHAVFDGLNGKFHPMHKLYHPNRLSLFFSQNNRLSHVVAK